jgi:arylsulfatase A-like enzyme
VTLLVVDVLVVDVRVKVRERTGDAMARDDQQVIGRTAKESQPRFPARPRPAGAPNVVVVLLDDTGFAQLGPFGSEIETPTIDRLAAEGLRYNRFHVTALCSPSRASLLTGRNHHAVGMGFLADLPMGFPGYTARIPRTAASLARILRDAGYNTMAVGKWHLNPRDDRSASGPFETWPLGQGFERYYGFLHGDANHWTPTLVADNHYVDPPRRPEEGYHLTEDLVDTAIRMVVDQKHATPDKPFFLYLAPGAMHAPHHVRPEWSDRYRGRFDDGWDRGRDRVFARQLSSGVVPAGTVLPPRPSWVQAWDELSAPEQQLFARFQEVFAGFLTHFDHELGRLVASLEQLGVLDDTIVMLTSDNGASAEGGRVGSINEHRFAFGSEDDLAENLAAIDDIGGYRTYNHYPWGWAWAGNAPFRLWKRYTWLGGTRTPLIVRWPGEVADPGGVRGQLCHIIDLFPTILDACGVAIPEVVDGITQQPVDGRSLRASFADPSAAEVRTTQYFEMLGSRSIIHDGWKATTDHVSQGVIDEQLIPGSRSLDDDRWNLFRMDDDFAEATDLADVHPDIVAALDAVWWAEAERNHVLPIEDSLISRLHALVPPLWPTPARLVLRPGASPLADEAVPSLAAGSLLVAEVDVPAGGGEGVLCAMGDWTNGWALVVLDGRPTFLLNLASTGYEIAAVDRLREGRHRVGFRYRPDGTGGGVGTVLVDDVEVARAELPQGMGASGLQIGGGGLRLGHDAGFPVSESYTPPFPWTGVLHHLAFDSARPSRDQHLAEAEELLRRE